MKRTLTGQLFLRTLPIMLALLMLIAIFAFYSCRREIYYVYDTEMVNDAQVLWGLVADELHERDMTDPKRIESKNYAGTLSKLGAEAEDYGNARMFRIWLGEHIVMASDTGLPKTIPRQQAGFSMLNYHEEYWRLYTMLVPNTNIAIEVGEKRTLRNTLVWNILIDLLVPLLFVVPLLAIGLWGGLRNGLRATQTLVSQIYNRTPDDLSTVNVPDLPRDLAPLSNSINRLFGKLTQSISAERRFADHAAHQLRTPLAGSRLLIQMLKDADSDEERDLILADLAASNNQATELVNRLLIAARVSHQPVSLLPVHVYPLVARVLAEIAPLAAPKSLALSLDGAEDAEAIADEILLILVITNLIENAIKYTPEGGRIAVSIQNGERECVITITDTGPGIPAHERELVFQRFYRAALSDVEGTGLGLAIVADCVRRFNGSIALEDGPKRQGLAVRLSLPKRPPNGH